jgi:hypothetical protein
MLAIFTQCRRANRPHLSTSQRRLEDLCHIHRTIILTGSDDGMDLIDK